MSKPIIYVDHSSIREGKFTELKAAMKELVKFVQTNEPQLIAYNVYFNEDKSQMTVFHIHSDSASLEFHMDVSGSMFPRIAEFIKLGTIEIYGQPSENLNKRLTEKAKLLGNGTVMVHALHDGFARLPNL
ncbi:MAG: hypothetical protein WD267_02300 [Balneolales bacterium]